MKNLGDRMKNNYEDRYRFKLTRRVPVILRLDGKSFHTLTKSCVKPFDDAFIAAMSITASYLLQEIQGAKVAYVASDEISLLLTDFDTLTTDAWFDYNVQKMCSIAASMASTYFTNAYLSADSGQFALFDCRAFNIPEDDVANYFIWRQKDWIRNSVSMAARAHFSHKECHKKSTQDLRNMLINIHQDWYELPALYTHGLFIFRPGIRKTYEYTYDILNMRIQEAIHPSNV